MKTILILTAAAALAGCGKHAEGPAAKPREAVAHPNESASSIVASAPAKQYDGPFGLASAMPIAELERLKFKSTDSHPEIYEGTPPKPLEGASSYMVVATPGTGACRIRTSIDVATVNGSGDQLKAAVDRVAEMMQVKYGKYSIKADLIQQDVYRRNPQFWMMGLREDSVMYGYAWNAGKTEKALPGDIDEIQIDANTSSTDSGYVSIQYTFKNFRECRKEMTQKKAANL